MKKSILLTLLFLSTNGFAYNWKKISEVDGDSYYIDIDDLKKQNGFVYYSELIDLKEAVFGKLSSIGKFKANCDDKRKAMLSITSYTGQMGKYILINEAEYDGTRFTDASQSTVMKFACDNAN